MTKHTIARFAGIAAGAVMILGFASSAGAQTVTVAQLQAQIAALMAQLNAMQGSSTTGTAAITSNLTVGSTGSQVTTLQNSLIAGGYLHASATGYFGSLTKAAVMAWQAANGLPATGFFGPLSMAKFNASAGATVTGGTTVGGTTTGGTVSAGSTTSGTITTPGVEGVLNVTAGPLSSTVLYAGQTMVPVMTVRNQAQLSDIAVERITVDLGTSTNIYNKVFTKLYAVDAATGQVLASQVLNSSTVTQSGTDYIVNLSGFSDVVKAGTYKDIQIKADLYSSINTTYANGTSYTFTIPANGVRGTDGAGIDQYGPTGSFNQSVTVNQALTDSAQANIALSPSSPLTNSVPVTDTTNNQYLQLPLLAFQVTAQNDSLHLHQVEVDFTGVPTGNTTATATAAYLYNGTTEVGTASINTSTGVATFANITDGTAGASIPLNTAATFWVKADVTGVSAGSLAISAKVNTGSTKTIIYNSLDSQATNSGSSVGNTITVLGKGPAFVLNGTPTLAIASTNTNTTSGVSTSTLTATFNVTVTAVGGDVMFGTQASATPMFLFDIYKSGVVVAPAGNVSTSTFFQIPSNVTTTGLSNSFVLSQGNSVTIPVTYSFDDRLTTGALTGGSTGNSPFTVDVAKLQWVTGGVAANTTYTAGQPAWTTNQVVGAAR